MVEGGQGPQGLLLFSFISFTNDPLYNVCLGFTVYIPQRSTFKYHKKFVFHMDDRMLVLPTKSCIEALTPSVMGGDQGQMRLCEWVHPGQCPWKKRPQGACVLSLSTCAHRVRSFQDAVRGRPSRWKDSPHQKAGLLTLKSRALISDFQTLEL